MTWEQFNAATQIRCKVAHKEPLGRSLRRGEIEATEGEDVQAVRDRAILVLLYRAGLPGAEATSLKLTDYELDIGHILVRSGKGRFCNATRSRAVSELLEGADTLLNEILKALLSHHLGSLPI